jgi:hypothetical protein
MNSNRPALASFVFFLGILVSGCGGGSSPGGGGMMTPPASNTPFWAQWGANPLHEGMVPVAGQQLANKLADIVYDPFVSQEQTASNGELLVHYQAAIVDGNDVYMMTKTGMYTSPSDWASQIWNETRFTWENGTLTQIWTFQSDWKPETNGSGLQGWEPVFHAVDANNFIYVPGASGTIYKVDKNAGTAASHINPFAGANPAIDTKNTFVSGPLTADANGNIYYNVIVLADPSLGDPWSQNDVQGAWLVKVTPQDATSTVTYNFLLFGNAGPPPGRMCPGTFFNLNDGGASLPWPPVSPATPPAQLCGSPRPGVNIAPAVGPDGTVFTASLSHFDALDSNIIAVNPDLSVKWVASLQNRLNDGCGVDPNLPISGPANNTPNSCRNGTTPGVDPVTNASGSGFIIDLASSSPTVLPDGSVLFGAFTNYSAERGHLFHFDSTGKFLNAFSFGWDSTPGVWTHGNTFSIVIKDNHYDAPGYCFFQNPICQVLPPGPYYITQLDPNLNIEWRFQSTTIDANHPNGYEWCINMPAIDSAGNVYVNSEDGNVYAIAQPATTGPGVVLTQPAGKIFLKQAIGAAYTPLSIGPDGKFYTQNDGHLFSVGN